MLTTGMTVSMLLASSLLSLAVAGQQPAEADSFPADLLLKEFYPDVWKYQNCFVINFRSGELLRKKS